MIAHDVATGTTVGRVDLSSDAPVDGIRLGDGLDVSADGTIAVADNNEVVLLDPATLEEVRRLRGQPTEVTTMTFSATREPRGRSAIDGGTGTGMLTP